MSEAILHNARVLIVDDELANVRFLEILLRQAGYTQIQSTMDAREALPGFIAFQPDIVLLDLMMPHLDGFAVMEQLQPHVGEDSYLPILVLTADHTPETKRRALARGAKDFLSKPLDTTEVLLRINNLLQVRFQNQILEERVRERTHHLEAAQREIVERMTQLDTAQTEMLGRLAQAGEFRDDETGHHTYRVGRVAGLLARQLGISPYQVELIERSAPLHDVGKIGIPDAILLKAGPLTEAEFAIMKAHTTIGAALLADGNSTLVKMAERIALTHHERWIGTGYPQGLQGEAIPIAGRIVAIADVFDALTHERPYKAAWPVVEATAEIERQRGHQFDPRVVEAFLTLPHQTLV